MSPCQRFVPTARDLSSDPGNGDKLSPRPRWHWPQASFYRKNREGRSGYLSLILSPFIPRGQIRIRLKASHRAARRQNDLICPLKRLYPYTLIHLSPLNNRGKWGQNGKFVPGPRYHWPQGTSGFVPCIKRFVPDSEFCPRAALWLASGRGQICPSFVPPWLIIRI